MDKANPDRFMLGPEYADHWNEILAKEDREDAKQ